MTDEKAIAIDSEMAVARIGKLLPRWLAWGVDHGEVVEVVVRKREDARTLEQNNRMWKMLSLLEQHGIVCEAYGRPMSATAWHDYLRIKHGYIHGTRLVPMPNGAGGFQLVETQNPQPTHKGGRGQMTKAQHSDYMERIHDELHDAGIAWDEAA